MNIGLVSPYSWDVPGGVNRHVERLAAYLRERGHRVTIIAPGGEAGEGFYSAGRTVPVPANRSVANICFGPGAAARVRRFLAASRFDVLHLHEPLIPSVSMLALLYSRAANVGTFHAAREGGSLGYLLARPVLEPLVRRLHLRAAVSPAAVELVSRYFPGEYRLLPNGVDTQRFNPRGGNLFHEIIGPHGTSKRLGECVGGGWGAGEDAETVHWEGARGSPSPAEGGLKRRISGLDPAAFHLLFVGRKEPRKGLHVLLRALPRVRREHPEVRLLVVGTDGGRRGEEGVTWLGRLPDELLPAAYRTAQVMVVPSLGRESFGIILLEAMACGVPVVASDIPGYRSVVEDGVQGLLVPPGDPEALASAILALVEDAHLRRRLAEAGRERAEEYSWERLVAKVEEAYREALETKALREG
ncbi:MAG: glycosyltransferase family 4 protein [Actinomycetota bacterium]|nr:glycosyltransferase family 4 protein [Actinomycetota bacterium]MDI7250934.1 glycosyltransferase family 4 protein [Actinomycetota bacterium]